MIYTKLVLYNIGAYLGRHELNLSPVNASKNIILIGGQNGAGKTTLLEALRLCLFGSYAFGLRTETELYNQTIRSMLNTKAVTLEEDLYQIDLEFKYTENYSEDCFKLSRSWSPSDHHLREQLTVTKNGEPLSDIMQELFLAKIHEEIPPKLFEFCLFDGEEISRIILDNTLPKYLSQIAKVLFNLDLFENLESDLTQFSRQSTLKPAELAKLSATETNLKTSNEQMALIIESKAKLATDRDQQRSELEQLKKEYSVNGGLAKEGRDQLLVEIQELEVNKRRNDDIIKEFTSELLPFFLANKTLKNTQIQMVKEQSNEAFSYITNTLQNVDLKPLVNSLGLYNDSSLSEKLEKKLSMFFLDTFRPDAQPLIHKASSEQRSEIERLSHNLDKLKIPGLLKLFRKNNSYRQKIQTVRKQIEVHDSTHELEQYMQKIEQLYEAIAFHESELIRLDTEQVDLEKKLMITTRELEILNSKLREIHKLDNAYITGNQILEVSKKFRQLQLIKRLQQVEIETAKLLQMLFRKDQLLSTVSIHPETFELTLHAADSSIVNKQKLSAGEKEILLLAIIWAMVKCSSRKLPFVFDTLLGRLDRTHRETIATKLLPKISEQVILLTTDSEIDQDLYSKISEHLARTYTLDNLNDEEEIVLREDLFFSLNVSEAAS